jgi:ATP-dependent helicase/nuclease subunit B
MRIYTIPAGAPFADLLVAGIMREFCPSPDALADAVILVPTRRAARALRAAFRRAAGTAPLLLPRLEPIGDVDDDELLRDAGIGAPDLPPAISPTRRRAVVTEFLRGAAGGDDPALACRLAESLLRLLDSAALEDVSLDRLDTVVAADLAVHWQRSLDILKVLREAWPRHLGALGLVDPATRRIAALRRRAEAWRGDPPRGWVIAAGSTGSIPATADLLGAVARLPRGALVLPGLDQDLGAEDWQAVQADPVHPQHALAQLLQRFGVAPAAVLPWPGAPAAHPRGGLLRAALLPASRTPAWAGMARPGPEAFAGLEHLQAPTQQDEALAIALALREAVETPGRSAALVSADRVLARRVAAELRRWGLAVDDSGGTPLSRTPPGAFLRATAAWAADPSSPVALLAALKHPFARLGLERGALLAALRRFERKALRGLRPAPGLAGLRAAAQATEDARCVGFADLVEAPLADFAAALATREIAPADLLAAHVACMEALAAPDAEALRAGEAGEALALALEDLGSALGEMRPIAGASWPALLEALLDDRVVRPRLPSHPRLSIWGPLEARLQSADLIVLGGLNEGVWPPEPRQDPWLCRPMRTALGLPPVERRVGQSAHDFVQAAAAPRVLLTWSQKIDGVPAAPARWLQRLTAFLGDDAAWTLCAAPRLLGLARALDAGAPADPPARPAPRPPAALRPARLPVTAIETLVRDPYAVYARRILRLRPLDPLDAPPGAAERGTIVHAALRDLIAGGAPPGPGTLDQLLAHGRRHFATLIDRPAVAAIWWPRFVQLARWFVGWETRRRAAGAAPLVAEGKGTLALPGGFVLDARADRIDLLADGTLSVIDYKTGAPPSAGQVDAGFSPQLPLEAAIARAGGFVGVAKAEPGELLYLRLSGGIDAGTERRILPKGKQPAQLASEALAGLERLVARYADQAQPYLARPRVRFVAEHGDYDRLARVAEWAAADGGAEA